MSSRPDAKEARAHKLIRKILVATDGSEHAQRALYYAEESALNWNSELIIISVVPPISSLLLPTPGFNIKKYISELENAYQNVLIEAEEHVKRESPEIKTSTQLGKGRPAEIIIEIAEKENVDLIVMGSRGYGSITGWILGSTSRHVVEHCTKPILIIK